MKVTHDGQEESNGLEESVQEQLLEHYMNDVTKNRVVNTEILMENLRFVGKNGQPLYMMPLLKPDPELLERPLYH